MGILAPLYACKETEEELILTSGWGTFKSGVYLMIFSGVILMMWIAIKPLVLHAAIDDPLLKTYVPRSLWTLATMIGSWGLLTMGYRKTLIISRPKNQLLKKKNLWGIPLKTNKIALDQIMAWQLKNLVSKHYQPEFNVKNRPVGFWQLQIETKDGPVLTLDQAPKEEEMRTLLARLQAFSGQRIRE